MIGHLLLAIPGYKEIFFLGLVFVAGGTGLLKPNISTIVGDLYADDKGARRDAGFSIFYMGINMGSLLGQTIVGYLGEKVDWHLGFGSAALGMLLGLIFYRMRAQPTLGDIGMEPKAKLERLSAAANGVKKPSTGLTVGLAGLLSAYALCDAMAGPDGRYHAQGNCRSGWGHHRDRHPILLCLYSFGRRPHSG